MHSLPSNPEQAVAIRATGWIAIADDNLSFNDARQILIDKGNTIVEEDEANRKFKVLDTIVLRESLTVQEAAALGWPYHKES